MSAERIDAPDTDALLAWDTVQAAKALSLSVTWLEQMRVKGGGPKYVKIGRRVLYRPSDLADWLESNLRSHTSQPMENHQ